MNTEGVRITLWRTVKIHGTAFKRAWEFENGIVLFFLLYVEANLESNMLVNSTFVNPIYFFQTVFLKRHVHWMNQEQFGVISKLYVRVKKSSHETKLLQICKSGITYFRKALNFLVWTQSNRTVPTVQCAIKKDIMTSQ